MEAVDMIVRKYILLYLVYNSQNMFISHNTIKTKCHFDLVTLLESCGGKVWWETCLIQEFFSLLRRPPPFRFVLRGWNLFLKMNLTILRVFLNLGILNLEETNRTDPLVHAPKTNLTLNALRTLLLYLLINRLAFYENLLRQKLDNIYFVRML